MLAKNKGLIDENGDEDYNDIQEEEKVIATEKKQDEFDFDEEAFNIDENLDDLDFDDDDDDN